MTHAATTLMPVWTDLITPLAWNDARTLVLVVAVGFILGQFATPLTPNLLAARLSRPVRSTPPIGVWLAVTVQSLLMHAGPDQPVLRPPGRFSRRFRNDPLAKYRAVTGVKARIRWWERLRGLIGLAALIVILGAALALLVILFFAGLRVVLELIIE